MDLFNFIIILLIFIYYFTCGLKLVLIENFKSGWENAFNVPVYRIAGSSATETSTCLLQYWQRNTHKNETNITYFHMHELIRCYNNLASYQRSNFCTHNAFMKLHSQNFCLLCWCHLPEQWFRYFVHDKTSDPNKPP